MAKKVTLILILSLLTVTISWSNTTMYDGMIQKYSSAYGLDPYLVKGLIKTESDFNPNAVSHKGAIGLCQIMPATGRGMGYSKQELYNPDKNIEASCRFLSFLKKKAQAMGHKGAFLTQKILQGYYAGPAHLKKKYIDLYHMAYVSKVLKNTAVFRRRTLISDKSEFPGYKPAATGGRKMRRELNKIYFTTSYRIKGHRQPLPESDFRYFREMDNEFRAIVKAQEDSFNDVVRRADTLLNSNAATGTMKESKTAPSEDSATAKLPEKTLRPAHFKDSIVRILDGGEVRIQFISDKVRQEFMQLSLREKLKVLNASPVRRGGRNNSRKTRKPKGR